MAMVNGTTFGINQSLFVSKNTHYQTKEITHFPSISRTDVYASQPDDSKGLNIEKLLKPMTADTAHSLRSRYTITNMTRNQYSSLLRELRDMGIITPQDFSVGYGGMIATVYKGNLIKNLIMDCQSYTKYRPNETTGGIFVSWRRKEELPTGLD